MKSYYEILEVSKTASNEVIKMAYKALVKKYHPDSYVGDKNYADKMIKKINEAYEILSNTEKRNDYDLSLENENTKVEEPVKQDIVYNKNEQIKQDKINNYTEKNNSNINEKSFNLKLFLIISAIAVVILIILGNTIGNLIADSASENAANSDINTINNEIDNSSNTNNTSLNDINIKKPNTVTNTTVNNTIDETQNNEVLDSNFKRDSIQIGDTQEFVINIMGKPDKVEENNKSIYWYYGDLKITFDENNKVIGINNVEIY